MPTWEAPHVGKPQQAALCGNVPGNVRPGDICGLAGRPRRQMATCLVDHSGGWWLHPHIKTIKLLTRPGND